MISAFEPFGGRRSNTSADLAAEFRKNPSRVGFSSYRIITLPVNFRNAWPRLRLHLERYRPNVVLLLGEKSGRSLTLETTAHNRRTSKRGLIPIAKNSQQQFISSLPVKTIAAAARQRGNLPKKFFTVGNDAGTYLCNFIYYKILSSQKNIPALLVHVPALTDSDFETKHKIFLQGIASIATELIKAIDGAGANYISREN